MTSIDAFPASHFDTRAARSEFSFALPVDIRRLILLLQIFVALIIGLGIVREIVIEFVGTETVLKDLRHFALDAERNLDSWYDSISMMMSSLLLFLLAGLSHRFDRPNRLHWTILAIIFLAMSIDATVSFHEVTVAPLRKALDLGGIFYFSWVLLATPFVLGVGLYFIPFLFRLPRKTAIRFVVAGLVFVGGALGTEFLCGYLATTAGMESLPYRITAASQECLEVIGMTLFVIALLRHLALTASMLRFEIRGGDL